MTIFELKALSSQSGYRRNGFSFNFCKRFNITDGNDKNGKFRETYIFEEKDMTVSPPVGISYMRNNDFYPEYTETVKE